MNSPSPVHDEDQGEEVFIDENDIINEYDVDEEELPDADDGGGTDGEEGSDIVDDSIHIFTGHTGELYVVACSPTDPTLVATGGGDDKGFFWKINQGDWTSALEGRHLEAQYPHLYWSPCAAHCLDLMLEDFFKLPHLKKVYERAMMINGYIYNRPRVLNMMREFTRQKDMVRAGKTRFATAFLTLKRFQNHKASLRKMFTSEKWTTSRFAKEAPGKRAAEVILMPSFWNMIVYAVKVGGPVVKVLRLVDGEKKPPMSYIYEAMDRAKEAIVASFDNKEDKYKDIFAIIDHRWTIQLHRPLHAAGHFLNPEFFYSNSNIENDNEVVTGLYKCIARMCETEELQDKIMDQLPMYKKAEGLFGMPMAVRQRNKKSPGHQDSVSSLAFSVDGQLLASGGLDGVVKIWDTASGDLKCTLEGPTGNIEWVRWHPKGHLILAGSDDSSVWMWNADKAAYLNIFTGHGSSVTCGDFTPDGKIICSGSDDATMRIWNPKTGEIIHVVRGHPYHTEGLTCLTINSDSSLVLTGSTDGSVHIVNVSTGKVVSSLSAHSESIECAAFEVSSRGAYSMVATGGMDRKLVIWDLQHSSPRCTCEHEDGVTCLLWPAGSRYIATGCVDGKVRIWDSLSGDCAKIFCGHAGPIQSIDASSNGEFLVSVSVDGTARVFEIADFR